MTPRIHTHTSSLPPAPCPPHGPSSLSFWGSGTRTEGLWRAATLCGQDLEWHGDNSKELTGAAAGALGMHGVRVARGLGPSPCRPCPSSGSWPLPWVTRVWSSPAAGEGALWSSSRALGLFGLSALSFFYPYKYYCDKTDKPIKGDSVAQLERAHCTHAGIGQGMGCSQLPGSSNPISLQAHPGSWRCCH